MKKKLQQSVTMALLIGGISLVQPLTAQGYLSGDFHQHTTYSDGSYSFAHMMAKNNQYGLDWWANNDHGGGFNRDGRVSGSDLSTTIYWDSYAPNPIIGTPALSSNHQVMWRWQSLRDNSFVDVLTARLLYPTKTIIQGYEWNVPGHEHASFGIITNQFDALPNCNPVAEFEFKFDGSDNDQIGGVAQGWTKSVLTDHAKTLEAISWLQTNYTKASYVVPAHPERQKKYKINHFRDMNEAGPDVCFGFESMPGHQKSSGRGGYSANSDGGVTYGGCGVYAAKIGGLWDAMLSEGRKFWLFASSDCHDEAGDFYPGEYQKTYTYTAAKTPQAIVDGLRSGCSWVVEGDLIDSLVYNIETVEQNRSKAGMGSTLNTYKGKSIKITIKARDPQGANHNTYSSYTNPELNHIDLIKGKLGAKIASTDALYTVDNVATTSVIARFDAVGGVTDTKNITSQKWKNTGNGWVEMSIIIPNVTDSVYFRLRGSNLGLNVANETDADGNPLTDALMGTNNAVKAFADLWFYSNPIFVYTIAPSKVAKFQIKQGSDDLEEALAPEAGFTQTLPVGQIDWTSSDLELGCEGSGNSVPQLIGFRFPGISLPKDKVIKNAYLELEVDVATSKVDPCNLIIRSEDNDNPATFTNTASVLSSRPKSTNSVAWNVASNQLNVKDQRYLSSNIVSLVQANLNREGWNAGNAMAFYVTGSGRREMESYEGENAAAAALVIEYEMNEQEIREMQIADSIAYDKLFGNHVTVQKVYTNYTSKNIGTYQNINFREGGFSGLYPIPGTNGKEFYTLSDRGVNVDAKNATCKPSYDKIFPFSNYAPKMHRIRINGDSIQIIQTTSIRRPNGTTATGLINPTGFGSTVKEIAWRDTTTNCNDLSSVLLNKDVWGIDCEGIAVSKNNEYWLCEEGGPTVWRLNSNGTVVNRYSPYANLAGAQVQDIQIDTVFKYRKNNRGFEGVAITPSGKVYSIIQSPILYPNKSDGEKSFVHRILEINPATNETKMYAYLNPGIVTDGTNTIGAKDWKIGDLSAINDSTFLVIEQGVAGTFAQRNIYKLNINNATPITSGLYNGKTVEQLKDMAGLTGAGIVPVQKTLYMDMKAAGWPDSLDKAEGLAIMNDSTIAVCNDNDFGQMSATENGIAEVTNIKSQLYVFNLTGDYKLKNFVPQSQLITNHADTAIIVAKAKVEADYTIPSYTGLKFAMVKATNLPDSANIAQLEKAALQLNSKDIPYSINMALNGDPTSRMGFAWYNNAGVTGGKVEVVAGNSTDFGSPLFSVDATSTALENVNYNVSGNNLSTLAGIASNSKKSYMSNKALVTGLTPNTTYAYRVGKTGAWSEIGTFTTAKANKEPFSFVYTTDPQANAVEMFDISQKTTHAADVMFPNANFWLNCGDLIETSGDTNSEWEYEQFFQTQQDIFLKKPTAYIIGNHDKSKNKNFSNHFNTESVAFDQSKSTTPGSVYSFVYGDALFMAMSHEDYSVSGYLNDLTTWMRAQVAAHPEVKWRIAFYHKPLYTGSVSHQSDADGKTVRNAMGPIYDELKIDLALQGHDHIYQVMGPIKNKALVANAVSNQVSVSFDARQNVTGKLGGTFDVKQGTLFFLNNSAGKKKYEPRSEADMNGTTVATATGLTNYFGLFTGRFGQTGRPTYSNIRVCTDSINIDTYEVSDLGVPTPFDSFKVIKSSDVTTANQSIRENNIGFYPVPVKDYAYVTFKDDVKANIEIYSVSGSLVKIMKIDGSSQVDLSNLSKGCYTLKVVSGTSNYAVKFIKE